MPEQPNISRLEYDDGVLILEDDVPVGVEISAKATPSDFDLAQAIARLSTERGEHLNFDLEKYPPMSSLGRKSRSIRVRVWLDGLDRG